MTPRQSLTTGIGELEKCIERAREDLARLFPDGHDETPLLLVNRAVWDSAARISRAVLDVARIVNGDMPSP